MKRLATAAQAAVLLVSACGGTKDTAAPQASPTIAADASAVLFSEHFERNLELNPLSATFIGDYRFNDRMANTNGPEYRAAAMDGAVPLSMLDAKIDRWIEAQP